MGETNRVRFAIVRVMLRGILAGSIAGLVLLIAPVAPADEPPPLTGFEQREGAGWTTYDEEIAFLATVDARSERVRIDVIGRSGQGRAIHLVQIGSPRPPSVAESREAPIEMHVCTQHGNEPAPREACLQSVRDLAFTDDAELLALMQRQTFLFVPTANPDGRAANARENAGDVDINRDHLNVKSSEARAIGRVIRDLQPAIVVDHHEYGPGEPVLYDDDVLYLWPRNLNVHTKIREIGKAFSIEHLKPCLAEEGYTSDEYGIEAVGDVDINQTAGDHDEGIARNAMGLRHSVGILVESAVSPKAMQPTEAVDGAENARRRVDSHLVTIACTIEFMDEQGSDVRRATIMSRAQKVLEGMRRSEPVYFDGQDEDPTLRGNRDRPTEVADPPPCGYRVTAAEAEHLATAFEVHGIVSQPAGPARFVSMAQAAEPLIPLLLDARAARSEAEGKPMTACPSTVTAGPTKVLGRRAGLPATGSRDLVMGGVLTMLGAVLVARALRTAR
jgi:hypothetical protein